MENSIQSILLAEDNNEHYINFLQAVNSISNSIDVMRVINGYDLLTMLETNIQPNVLFLDIDMPYKGGLQILEEMNDKLNSRKIPVIIFSASSYELVARVTYELGAILFVKKYNHPGQLKNHYCRFLIIPTLKSASSHRGASLSLINPNDQMAYPYFFR